MGELTDEPLGRLLAGAIAAVIDDLHERLSRAGWPEIRPLWGFVLLALRDQPRTIGDLGTLIGVSKQAAAKVTASLLNAGLVVRDEHPTDRRAASIQLSDSGRQFLVDAGEAYGEIEAGWIRAVGQREVRTMRKVLAEGIRLHYGDERPPLRQVL